MDYLQTLFGFFNAPLFATFILGMFWKRMTATAGWTGLVAGTLSAIFVFILGETGVINLPGQGVPFVAASAAFVVDIIVSVAVTHGDRARSRQRNWSGWCTRRHRRTSSTTPRAQERPGSTSPFRSPRWRWR